MAGTLPGNIFGPIYFIYFQLAGIISAFLLLKKESTAAKLTVGSAFGSLCMQWLCALSAFIFGFNIKLNYHLAQALHGTCLQRCKEEGDKRCQT